MRRIRGDIETNHIFYQIKCGSWGFVISSKHFVYTARWLTVMLYTFASAWTKPKRISLALRIFLGNSISRSFELAISKRSLLHDLFISAHCNLMTSWSVMQQNGLVVCIIQYMCCRFVISLFLSEIAMCNTCSMFLLRWLLRFR